MTLLARWIAVAALAAGGIAAPLAAQYQPYPQQGYPQPYPQQFPQQYPQPYPEQYPQPYPQPYGYSQNSTLGGIIDGLIGNRYSVSDRQAIHQCTYAAVNQAEAQYRPYYNPNFRRPYQGYEGYMRVAAITEVQRRSQGRVRVKGLLDSGLYGGRSYGYGYGGAGDLTFRCDVDYRGQVYNVRINRNEYYRRY